MTNPTKTPSKRSSSTDLTSRPSKKPQNAEPPSSTSDKQSSKDPSKDPSKNADADPEAHDDPSQNNEQTDSTEGIHEWKTRPPYQIHKDEAAPFQWAAIFHKTDINFTSGHHGLEWYDPSSKSVKHSLPCKVRCSYCHSPIMDEGRNMVLLFPSLVHFKSDAEKRNFRPKCHMFYGERVIDVPDGLPKWSGMKDKSDLIEDSPEEDVKEYERKKREEGKEGGSEEKTGKDD
ncbi:hypothetical protein FKW77_008842 [Venturia effusa]|uniref:CENP-V/GFA domain-containing protein n=1 Tax=Venturia effusa TaxID=50376 RepID=A0A517KZZ9_9PEZI|nr:hypothetical protein FKW77_008842 [Venturia effusa]